MGELSDVAHMYMLATNALWPADELAHEMRHVGNLKALEVLKITYIWNKNLLYSNITFLLLVYRNMDLTSSREDVGVFNRGRVPDEKMCGWYRHLGGRRDPQEAERPQLHLQLCTRRFEKSMLSASLERSARLF